MTTTALSHIDPSRWPDIANVPSGLRASGSRPIAAWIFQRAVNRMPIRVILPDGEVLGGGRERLHAPTMTLHHPQRFLRRIGSTGLIGFGESYCAGEWDSPDIAALIGAFAQAIDDLVPATLTRLRSAYLASMPERERSTLANAQSNIERHYDLSNDMFALFLDPTMSYSSALFDPEPEAGQTSLPEDLETAQARKIERMLDEAEVGPGTRLLEIGSGWGELAVRAAQRGAVVDTITLSTEQLRVAEQRIEAAGLSDRATAHLMDYREISGTYDAVVSVEMIEAIGRDHLDDYFSRIRSVLRPGGRAVIQAITMPHHRVATTRRGYTWIQKYIFPGGELASCQILLETADRHGLQSLSNLSFGSSYALTLQEWAQRFEASAESLAALGFDHTFNRLWRFYLGYSEGGFRSGYLDVHQLTFEAP